MLRLTIVLVLLASPVQAEACHRFSVWKYPFPQRCRVAQVQLDHDWFVEFKPEADIPLPSLENMEFPPDSDSERLKGVGLLRQKLGTN